MYTRNGSTTSGSVNTPTVDGHVEAAQKARRAGMAQILVVLLGAGGVARSEVHAEATARLETEMAPELFLSVDVDGYAWHPDGEDGVEGVDYAP